MPDYELEKIRGNDFWRAERNWRRLGRTVFHDMVQTSGLYDELNGRQRRILDRRNELALDPSTPLTRREIRRANQGHVSGVPLHLLPVILVAAGPIMGFEAAMKFGEKYAGSGKPGSKLVRKQLDNVEHKLTKSEVVTSRQNVDEVLYSSLRPHLNVGHHALRLASFDEPTDYIINLAQFTDTAQEAASRDGTFEKLEEYRSFDDFNSVAPHPMSFNDRLRHASGVFMQSPLLKNGDLFWVGQKHRVDYSPNGPTTFHLRVTNPYGPEDEETRISQQLNASMPDFPAPRVLEPNPFDELLLSSRV